MKTLFDGNLRIFDEPPTWSGAYVDSLAGMTIYAETAFGALYCVDQKGLIHLLNPETRNLTETECNREEFIDLIREDPSYYIDQQLYADCCSTHGKPDLNQHFSYRHPLALGGVQAVENVILMDAGEHMRFLGNISAQIGEAEPGTSFHPVGS